MNKFVLVFTALLVTSNVFADEVGQLRDMARQSEDYRDLSIDCLIELKMSKEKDWASDNCKAYKTFAKVQLQPFKTEVKDSTASFVTYSKSGDASKRRIKRGLKQLLIIQANMESLKGVSEKIKVAANS